MVALRHRPPLYSSKAKKSRKIFGGFTMQLNYQQFLKFSIIDAIMRNDDTDLEDLILKLLIETNNARKEGA
jgi:hypothetical protein